jgi:hypothetical protein
MYNGKIIFFLWLTNAPVCACFFVCVFISVWLCIKHLLKIQLSVDEHLGCFHVLALWVSLQWMFKLSFLFNMLILFPLDIYQVELIVHMRVLFLILKGNSIQFSIMILPIYISTNSTNGFPPMHILVNTYLFFLFENSHPNILKDTEWCLIVVLVYPSLILNDIEHLFMYLLGIRNFSLVKCLFSSLSTF